MTLLHSVMYTWDTKQLKTVNMILKSKAGEFITKTQKLLTLRLGNEILDKTQKAQVMKEK